MKKIINIIGWICVTMGYLSFIYWAYIAYFVNKNYTAIGRFNQFGEGFIEGFFIFGSIPFVIYFIWGAVNRISDEYVKND